MQRFKALLASKTEAGSTIAWQELGEADLMEGDVTVRVSHSTVNYKDGLAITGKAPVVRRWPMVPGIDFAGTVGVLEPCRVQAGRRGRSSTAGACGETHYGGYAQSGARQGRLAGAEAGGIHGRRGDGDRHGRLHGDAVRPGAGAARRDARRAARSWSPARPAASAASPSRCWPSSATRSSPRPGGASESRLSQGPRRRRDHRPRRAVGPAAAARQGALGRRRRRGRQPHARQRAAA